MNKQINFRCFPLVRLLSLGLMLAGFAVAGAAGAQSGSDKARMGELTEPGDAGQRLIIRGRVTDIDGTPLAEVAIGLRHADHGGNDFSYHRGTVVTTDKGVYQFASVVPGSGESFRQSHVHVTVSHPGYRYLNTEIHFKDDPKAAEDDPDAIFLEAGTIGEETVMFGRYDITLVPD